MNAPRKMPGATRLAEQENRRERDPCRRPDECREAGDRIERQAESGREEIHRGQPEDDCDLAQTVVHDPNGVGA